MKFEFWLLNIGAAGFVLVVILRRYCIMKRRPLPKWVPMVKVWSIMCWGLGLVLILFNRWR